MRMIINKKRKQISAGLLFFIALVFAGCEKPAEVDKPENPVPGHLFKRSFFVFGTILDVLVWTPSADTQPLEDALDQVEQTLNAMHHQWHAWKPGRLQKINQALRSGRAMALNAEESRFLARVKDLSLASQGFFDPAIGELVHLWGFHADEYPLSSPPPSPEAIKDWLQHRPGMQDLILENGMARSPNSRIWLDFGGVAKGLATDMVVDMLAASGFRNVIVNAGGDVRVRGKKGQTPWKVAIRSPGKDWGGPVLGVIESQGNEAIFTSGNYQRYSEYQGQRYAHILDPFTGWPVDTVASATVMAANGTLADAAATAMVVAGWDKWPQVARYMGIDTALLVGEKNRCEMTPAMATRLKDSTLACRIRKAGTAATDEQKTKP